MVQWLSHWFPTFSGWGDPGSNPDPAGAGADETKILCQGSERYTLEGVQFLAHDHELHS